MRVKSIVCMIAPLVVLVAAFSAPTPTQSQGWTMRGIDNMHATRDYMCNQQSADFMAVIAQRDRELGANLAAVDTPYDAPSNYHQCAPADPIAYERSWVQAFRGQGLHIWFRQTWFNWEGSYGAPKLTSTIPLGRSAGAVLDGTDTVSYLAKTYHFILDHPYLYADSDWFTSEPEPINGGVKVGWGCDGACQFPDFAVVNRWLRDSMTVDRAAFQQLGLNVNVGHWGLPCDTYRHYDVSTVASMGTFTTDCYMRSAADLKMRLDFIHKTYGVPVELGEWGEVWDGGQQPVSTDITTSILNTLDAMPYLAGMNYFQSYSGDTGEGLVDHQSLELNQLGRQIQYAYTRETP